MAEETTLNQAWGALRIVLRDAFSFYDIKEIIGLAGLDVTRLAHLAQRAGGGASKGQLITALDGEIRQLDESTKSRVLTHIAEDIVQRRPDQNKCLDEYLEQLGWRFVDRRLLPIELFDVAELAELPDAARTDLVKAAARLRDGDLDGALTSACAAVDSVTNAVHAEAKTGIAVKGRFPSALHDRAQGKGHDRGDDQRVDCVGVGEGRRRHLGQQSPRRAEPRCLRDASPPFANERRPRFETRTEAFGFRLSEVGGGSL